MGVAAWVGGAAAVESGDIAAIERRRGGRLGVFAVDTGSGRVLAHRADERFLMCSTFKGVLAGCVLSRVDAGRDDLGRLVAYGQADLVGYAPVSRAHVGEGRLSVGALVEAVLVESDNTAANLLLARIGGPAALTAYARGLGDAVTRFDRYEVAASRRSGVLDTTTPRAMTGLARRLLLGDALRPDSRDTLEAGMVACRSGTARLRAGLPRAWVFGDRSGTGDGECNDYGMARRPGRAPLLMAAYHDAPGMPLEAQEAVLREVAAVIAGWA